MIIGSNNPYSVANTTPNNYVNKTTNADKTDKTEGIKGKHKHGHNHHHIKKSDDGGITKTNGTDTLQLSPQAADALNKMKAASQSSDNQTNTQTNTEVNNQ
ncbi:hypothetical protein SAMN02745163_03592 [Clostridium cavendishii DSM 21758]|uniref:Uncharacterized protein n=1 Tax=Clostridium cavendishii DSM 21758 TaxID=1121302 RepID=A0A1M6RB48_9CLOT|nr:hypothetical protein [Clostridium cavendishii]SHK29662.1 hypothetical protein SAMN02745163_03592 [Clostridium cavendishii DSM 21758]